MVRQTRAVVWLLGALVAASASAGEDGGVAAAPPPAAEDGGRLPSFDVSLRAVTALPDGGSAPVSLTDGGSQDAVELELPPRVPIDQPFELRTWVPDEVRAASAEYWRAGADCSVEAGESHLPLQTTLYDERVVQAADGGVTRYGKELVILVPSLNEPWWNHCFAVSLWVRKAGQPPEDEALKVLLTDVTAGLVSDAGIRPEVLHTAARRAELIPDCADEPSWNARAACELAGEEIAGELESNEGLKLLTRSALDLRGAVDALHRAAGAVHDPENPAVSLDLPSFVDLLELHGELPELRNVAQPAAGAAGSAVSKGQKGLVEAAKKDSKRYGAGELAARLRAGEEETWRTISGRLERLRAPAGSRQQPQPKAPDNDQKAGGQSPTLAGHPAPTPKTNSQLSKLWMELLRTYVHARSEDLGRRKVELARALARHQASVDQAQARLNAWEEALAKRRTDRAKALARYVKNLQALPVLKARVAEARRALEPADLPPEQRERLQKAHDEAKKELEAAETLEKEYEKVAGDVEREETEFGERTSQLASVHVQHLTAKTVAEAQMNAATEAIANYAIVLQKLDQVQAAAARYSEAFALASSSLRASKLTVLQGRSGSRAKPAATHVDRAYGFFSADIGLGAVAPKSGEPHPLAFAQIAMSFGRISLDHGIGMVKVPKGTPLKDKLLFELGQRLSLNLGVSLNLRPIRTEYGELQGLFGPGTPMGMIGAGYRFTEFLKVNGGWSVGTTQPEIPGMGNRWQWMPFVGMSLDLPVYRAVHSLWPSGLGPALPLPGQPQPVQAPGR